jgi:hypothetical protein
MDKNEIVELFARMNLQQRNDFVECLVEKWPDLATSLSNMIGFQIQINKHEKFLNQNS